MTKSFHDLCQQVVEAGYLVAGSWAAICDSPSPGIPTPQGLRLSSKTCAWSERTMTTLLDESLTCIAWLTRTLIAVNLVYTGASITGVAGTVIQVDLTVGAWSEQNRGSAPVSHTQPTALLPPYPQAPVVPFRQKHR